jgi:hypothetical protein
MGPVSEPHLVRLTFLFSFFIEVRHDADWYMGTISFRSGEKLYGRCVCGRRLEFRIASAQATTH